MVNRSPESIAQRQEYVRRYNVINSAARREYQRGYRAANSERVRERDRAYQRRSTHGLNAIAWAEMWDAQDGKCYACDRDLDKDPKKTHVEHYHGCTAHGPKKSCKYCQRGLACASCNLILGLSGDDPAVLRQIADRLEAANRGIEARQANAPRQLDLGFGEMA